MSDNFVELKLAGMSLWGHHGTADAERTNGGPFRLTIEAVCPQTSPAEDDNLGNRLDYSLLADRAEEIFSEKRFSLLEPLAERMARILLEEFTILHSIRISIRKLKPLMTQELQYAEVAVHRTQPPEMPRTLRR